MEVPEAPNAPPAKQYSLWPTSIEKPTSPFRLLPPILPFSRLPIRPKNQTQRRLRFQLQASPRQKKRHFRRRDPRASPRPRTRARPRTRGRQRRRRRRRRRRHKRWRVQGKSRCPHITRPPLLNRPLCAIGSTASITTSMSYSLTKYFSIATK